MAPPALRVLLVVPLLAAAPAALAAGPSAAGLAWLLNETRRLVVGCQQTGVGGVQLFTPDASSSYGAQWTRDFTFALDNAAEVFTALQANVSAAVQYTFDRITPEGMVPDRVYADGHSIFAPSNGNWPITLAWDNMPFAGILLATALTNQFISPAFFCTYEPTAQRALRFLNVSSEGLAYNSDTAPNASWGFMDSIVLTRHTLFVSLLAFDSATRMADLTRILGCGNTTYYQQVATQIVSNVEKVFADAANPANPLYLASTGIDALPDVWGSAYAASLGVTPAARGQAIADFFAAQWAAGGGNPVPSPPTIFQEGQVTHNPQPYTWTTCWNNQCPAVGTYQRGAAWAVPLRWVVPTLATYGHLDVALSLLNASITSFMNGGVMEAINRTISYTGVKDYVASGTNVWGSWRALTRWAEGEGISAAELVSY